MSTANPISRRAAMALATVLTATFLTGVAAIGGLAHWRGHSVAAPAAIVQSQAPPAAEVDE